MEPSPARSAHLHVAADLVAEGPGGRLRLSGDGGDLVLEVDGALPAAPPATVARAGHLLAAAGLRVAVTDAAGRRLAVVGRGVRSPLGRLSGRGWRVRPGWRLLVGGRRSA